MDIDFATYALRFLSFNWNAKIEKDLQITKEDFDDLIEHVIKNNYFNSNKGW